MMSKKWMIYGLALSASIYPGYLLIKGQDFGETREVGVLSEMGQEKLMNEVSELVINDASPKTIDDKISTAIGRVSTDKQTELLFGLLYSMRMEQDRLMETYVQIAEELTVSYNNGEFKSGTQDFSDVKDKVVREYLEGLSESYFKVEEKGDSLFLSQDLDRFESEYGKYLDKSTKAFIDIQKEQLQSYPNSNDLEKQVFEKQLNLILFVESNRVNWENSYYHDEIQSMERNLYANVFGVDEPKHFDHEKGQYTFKSGIRDIMTELMDDYSNTFIGDDIYGYLNELESNKWQLNEKENFILNRISERFSTPSKVQSPYIQVSAPEGGDS